MALPEGVSLVLIEALVVKILHIGIFKGRIPFDQNEENHTQSKQVGGLAWKVWTTRLNYLRGLVTLSANFIVDDIRQTSKLAEAEVSDFEQTCWIAVLGGHENVLRLQVEVNDALLVDVVQPFK